jgi:hypothetical protein
MGLNKGHAHHAVTNPNPALAGCQAALDRIVEALVMGGKIALLQDHIV